MAQSTAQITYTEAGNRESLMDVITNISPYETPLLSELPKVNVGATLHEWMTESLSTYDESNAQIEGADYSFTRGSARTRVTNNTQILSKTWEVSGSQEAVDKAGIDSEYARRMQNAMKELATDVEASLMNGTGNSGASGTAREMKGVVSFITTNVETGTGTGSETLTEDMYNDLLQTIWEAGGKPDTTYVAAKQKRVISGFTASSTQNIDAADKKLVNSVEIYESDFGLQTIKLHRDVPIDNVVALEKNKWAVGVLRPVMEKEVSIVGDAMRGAAVGEMTLVAYNEAASGKITQLATA